MKSRPHRPGNRRTCSCAQCALFRKQTRFVMLGLALWLAIPTGLIALILL